MQLLRVMRKSDGSQKNYTERERWLKAKSLKGTAVVVLRERKEILSDLRAVSLSCKNDVVAVCCGILSDRLLPE